jgi:hypothetical protein
MHKVLTLLSSRLDRETRMSLTARAEGMMRGVRYEAERHSPVFAAATAAGWTLERIEIICSLNAFYQIVLGPLASVSRSNLQSALVRETPIAYGTKVCVTLADANLLRECHQQFKVVTEKLGIDFWGLQAAHANDLLYRLGQPQRSHE